MKSIIKQRTQQYEKSQHDSFIQLIYYPTWSTLVQVSLVISDYLRYFPLKFSSTLGFC